MDEIRRDELDMLFERALKDSVSHEAPPDRIWANIKAKMQGRGQQSRSRVRYLSHLGADLWALGSAIGSTVGIMLASLYIRSNGEEWATERLLVAGRSAGPPRYSVLH